MICSPRRLSRDSVTVLVVGRAAFEGDCKEKNLSVCWKLRDVP